MKNTKTGHTPGPWHVEVCKAGQSIITGLKYEDSIIQPLNVLAERHAAGEKSANAALIAAAPELLAALEAILKECCLMHRYGGSADNTKEANEAEAAGRAAIAKAKGEL
jgi:hypothetical protein